MYAQFNNLDDVNILLTALIYLGFDDVFEVGAAAVLLRGLQEICRYASGTMAIYQHGLSVCCPPDPRPFSKSD